MVINVGMLRSGRDQYVEDDIRAVVEAAGGMPVKVILEAHYLTDDRSSAAAGWPCAPAPRSSRPAPAGPRPAPRSTTCA